MKQDLTAMILAAGLGTRLQSLTHDRPKALVELNGKPLLQHCIENLISNDFHHIVINVHHYGEQIIDFVSQHHFDADIAISDERDLLMDTGGGIIKATSLFKDSKAVLVHNVDIISNVDFMTLGQQFLDSGDDAWLLTQDRETNRKLMFDEKSQLVGWMNKAEGLYKWVHPEGSALRQAQGPQQIQDQGSQQMQDQGSQQMQAQGPQQTQAHGAALQYKEMAFSGLHFFRSDLFNPFEEKPQSVIDLYLHLAQHNRILSKPIQPDYWFDLGKPEQLQAAETFLKTQRP